MRRMDSAISALRGSKALICICRVLSPLMRAAAVMKMRLLSLAGRPAGECDDDGVSRESAEPAEHEGTSVPSQSTPQLGTVLAAAHFKRGLKRGTTLKRLDTSHQRPGRDVVRDVLQRLAFEFQGEVGRLEELMAAIDTDRDGTLSPSELQAGVRRAVFPCRRAAPTANPPTAGLQAGSPSGQALETSRRQALPLL